MAGGEETLSSPSCRVCPFRAQLQTQPPALCKPSADSDSVLKLLSPSSDVLERATCSGGTRLAPASPGISRGWRKAKQGSCGRLPCVPLGMLWPQTVSEPAQVKGRMQGFLAARGYLWLTLCHALLCWQTRDRNQCSPDKGSRVLGLNPKHSIISPVFHGLN